MIRQEENITDEKADQLIASLEQSLQTQNAPKKEVAKTGVISDLFDKSILSQLEKAFAESNSGYYSLRADEFRVLIAEYIPAALVENVYRAIDVNDMGRVHYADFTNYLIASEAGSSFSARTVIAKLSFLHAQEEDSSLGLHRDSIDCLLYVRKPIPMLVSGGRDGQVALWEPDSLTPIAFVDHRDKNAVYQEEFSKGMDTLMKAKISKNVQSHHQRVPTKMAVTSLATLFNWGLLCVGSADCSVTVYELATQDVIGRFSAMEDIPTAIECFQVTTQTSAANNNTNTNNNTNNTNTDSQNQQTHSSEETVTQLVIGDSRGFLHCIKLDADFGNGAEVGARKKNQMSFARCVTQQRTLLKDVASDWITALKYVPEVNALLAASRDGSMSFVDVDKQCVMKVFRGHILSASSSLNPHNTNNSNSSNNNNHNRSNSIAVRSQSFSSEHSSSNNKNSTTNNIEIHPAISATTSKQQTNQVVHSGYGDPAIGGVACFDWSGFGKYVVSASERLLLFWDPFTCETMTRLENLRSPVVSLQVHDEANKVFVALANKLVLVLHNINFEILQQVTDPTIYRPNNALSAMAFASDRHTLFTAGHKLACWTLQKTAEDSSSGGSSNSGGNGSNGDVGSGSDEDLVAALYNNLFNQVMLVKSLGTLKIYQAETGELTRQFNVCPIDLLTGHRCVAKKDHITGVCLPLVLQASLDRNQTRLLLLASDLSLQFWSVTDGSPLTQVSPQLFSTSMAHVFGQQRKQVTQLLHDTCLLPAQPTNNSGNNSKNSSSAAVAEAGSKKARQLKILLLGTTLGHICGYQETQANIDEIPTAFLRISEDSRNTYNNTDSSVVGGNSSGQRRGSHQSINSTNNNTNTYTTGDNKINKSSSQQLSHPRHRHNQFFSGDRNHDVHSNNGSNINNEAVLWMRILPQTCELLVAYLSGKLVLWDLSINRRIRDLSVSSMGAILNGMKLKNKKSGNNNSNTSNSVAFTGINAVYSTNKASYTNNNNINSISTHHGHKTHPHDAEDGSHNSHKNYHKHHNNHISNSIEDDNNSHNGHNSEDDDDMDASSSASSTIIMHNHPHNANIADNTDNNSNISATNTNAATTVNNNSHTEASKRRREELEKEKQSAKLSVTAQAMAASVAAQFADTLDDILNDTNNTINSNNSSNRHNSKKEQLTQLVNGLDFSGMNATVTDRLTLVQRRAVAMQQQSLQLRRKDSALTSFLVPNKINNIQLHRHRTQHISLLRSNNNNYTNSINDSENNVVTDDTNDNKNGNSMTNNRNNKRKNTRKSSKRDQSTNDMKIQKHDTSGDSNQIETLEEYNTNEESNSTDGDDDDNDSDTNMDVSHNSNMDMEDVQLNFMQTKDDHNSTKDHDDYDDKNANSNGKVTSMRKPNAPSTSTRPSHSIHTAANNSLLATSNNIRKSLVHGARRLVVKMDGQVVSASAIQPSPHLAQLSSSLLSASLNHTYNDINNASNTSNNTSTFKQTAQSQLCQISQASQASQYSQNTTVFLKELDKQQQQQKVGSLVDSMDNMNVTASHKQPHPPSQPQVVATKKHHNNNTPHDNHQIHEHNQHHSHNHHHTHTMSSSDTSNKSSHVITVDCLTLLAKTRVLIGACSDRYLRFWDADTYHVLCSCLYLDVADIASNNSHTNNTNSSNFNNNTNTSSNKPVKVHLNAEDCGGEMLRHLQSSDSEDVLIGGYESGMIRIWSLQAYSLVTLRTLLQKHLQFQTLPTHLQQHTNNKTDTEHSGNGNHNGSVSEFGEGMALAIAPLSLLSEFRAHDCPILSMEYVWFNYEDGNDNNTNTNNAENATNNTKHAKTNSSSNSGSSRQRRDKASDMGQDVLDGYVLSAGLDQKVYLWNLNGRCVGEFGGYSWDMNVENTWLCTKQAAALLLSNANTNNTANSHSHKNYSTVNKHRRTDTLMSNDSNSTSGDADYQRDKHRLHQQILQQFRAQPGDNITTSGSSNNSNNNSRMSSQRRRLLQQSFHPRHITVDSLSTSGLSDSPSTEFLRHFCAESISREKEHSSAEIGEYLEVLTRKMQHKVANYVSMDTQFRDIVQKHPVREPSLPKKEDFRKLQKKLGIVGL